MGEHRHDPLQLVQVALPVVSLPKGGRLVDHSLLAPSVLALLFQLRIQLVLKSVLKLIFNALRRRPPPTVPLTKK